MKDQIPHKADEPIFRALLVPHRSLDRNGFVWLMTIVGSAWLATGAIFLLRGAWPVLGFCAIPILLLYVAFRLNYRAGRRHEEISVSRTCLEVRQFGPTGRSTLHQFNPFWARFDVTRNPATGITRMAIAGRGAVVTIGSFLNPDDRESFAIALSRALATARRG